MSYVRFLEADVYVFMHVAGYLECCGCSLEPDTSYRAHTTKDMLDHLKKHLERGDYVPDHVFVDITNDDERNFGRGAGEQ